MKPGDILKIILASVVILSIVIIQLNNDVLQKETTYTTPSFLSIRDVDVKPIHVTGSGIEVNVTAYINHYGGITRNATMLIRAINSDTRLLESQVFADIPETETEFEKTLSVSSNLILEKNGGYELNILLFDDGSIKDSGKISIQGLNALVSDTKRSSVTLNNIDFIVGTESAGKVSIKSDIYLENKGPDVSENLNMTVKAREAASNLIADRINTQTGSIINETTVVRSVEFTVPEGYNYMIVVELWRGNTMINTWEKPLPLAPTKTIPKESTEKNVKIEVSKFIREGEKGGMPYPAPTPEYPPQEPGFEIFAAISAIFVVFLIRRRSLDGQ